MRPPRHGAAGAPLVKASAEPPGPLARPHFFFCFWKCGRRASLFFNYNIKFKLNQIAEIFKACENFFTRGIFRSKNAAKIIRWGFKQRSRRSEKIMIIWSCPAPRPALSGKISAYEDLALATKKFAYGDRVREFGAARPRAGRRVSQA